LRRPLSLKLVPVSGVALALIQPPPLSGLR
jgi:hypothetical protein